MQFRVINFVNLQLIADGSNLVTLARQFPSEFAIQRSDNLEKILEFLDPDFSIEPFIFGGDFNTRLDVHAMIKVIIIKLDFIDLKRKTLKNESCLGYVQSKRRSIKRSQR